MKNLPSLNSLNAAQSSSPQLEFSRQRQSDPETPFSRKLPEASDSFFRRLDRSVKLAPIGTPKHEGTESSPDSGSPLKRSSFLSSSHNSPNRRWSIPQSEKFGSSRWKERLAFRSNLSALPEQKSNSQIDFKKYTAIRDDFYRKFPEEPLPGSPLKPSLQPLYQLSNLSLFLQKAIEIQQRDPRSFQYGSRRIFISLKEEPISDPLHVVAKIADEQESIYPNISNEEIRFKTFRDYSILISLSGRKIKNSSTTNVIEQYQAIQNLAGYEPNASPIAQIYNLEEIKAGCGYFLIEHIPFALPIQELRENPFDPEHTNLADQLKKLIFLTYKNGIDLDLRLENLGVRANGSIAIIHPRTHKEPVHDPADFKRLFFDMIQTLCAESEQFYAFLTESLSNTPDEPPATF